MAVVGLEEAAAVGVEEIAADADGDATAGGDVGLEGCGGGDEAAEKTLPLLCWGAVSLALATDCCSPLSLTGVPSSLDGKVVSWLAPIRLDSWGVGPASSAPCACNILLLETSILICAIVEAVFA